MAKTDIAGLLTGITSKPIDPMLGLSPQQRRMANVQQGSQAAAQGFGRMLGADIRPTEQKVQEALGKLNPDDPAQQQQILDIVGRFSPERVTALKAAFDKRNEELVAPGTIAGGQRKEFANFITEKYGQAYGDLARTGVLTPENMSSFIPNLTASGFSKGASSLGRDTEGNVYQITTAFNKDTSAFETKYAPYSPNAPKTPVGTVTPIATDTGMTLSEELGLKVEAKGKEKKVTDFAGMKSAAVDEITDTNEALYIGQNALQLLEEIETGGLTVDLTKRITDVFGVTPTSVTSFQNQVGQLMLKKLKLFGANPTEGERAALAELGAELKKGKGANKAIIERFVREQLRRKERLQFLTRKDTDNLQDYLDFVNSQYSLDVEPDTNTDVLDFDNLPKS